MTHPDRPSLVVCVQNPDTCKRLIRHGAALARENGWEMEVLSIQPRPRRGQPYPITQIEQLHRASREAGVQMTVYYGDSPAPLAIGYLQASTAIHLVLGTSPDNSDGFSKGFIRELRRAFPHMPMTLVGDDDAAHTLVPAGQNPCIPAALHGRG